ncbi:MAG: serine protease [Planctomycetota bacterium]|nr:MAG: serine protease [Planctomycetota bacterium]
MNATSFRLLPVYLLLFVLHVRGSSSVVLAEEPLVDLMSVTCRIVGSSTATGYLVERGGSSRAAWLVTVSHAFQKIDGAECQLVLRRTTMDESIRREITISIRQDGQPLWKSHASEDVAILAIELPEDVTMPRLPLSQLADEALVRQLGLSPGDDLWVAGYPSGMESNPTGWPILRQGHVASYPILPLSTNRTMLMQINSFGGDSGAPVAVVHQDRPVVVAMVVGLHRITTKQASEFEERTTHLPMHISYTAHASWIRELIVAQP